METSSLLTFPSANWTSDSRPRKFKSAWLRGSRRLQDLWAAWWPSTRCWFPLLLLARLRVCPRLLRHPLSLLWMRGPH